MKRALLKYGKFSFLFLAVFAIFIIPHSAKADMTCSVFSAGKITIAPFYCNGSSSLYRNGLLLGGITCNVSYNDFPGATGVYTYTTDQYNYFGSCSATIWPQCSDTFDNDGNGFIDLADPGCTSSTDTTEAGYNMTVFSNIPTTWSIDVYDSARGWLPEASGSGTSGAYIQAGSGLSHRITWGAVSGYITPVSQTLSGNLVIFNGNYTSAPALIDIGLRYYDGLSVVKIAADPQGTLTSPLRIAKNSIVYGISLVDITDPNASKIRIKTSGGIKAIRKL